MPLSEALSQYRLCRVSVIIYDSDYRSQPSARQAAPQQSSQTHARVSATIPCLPMQASLHPQQQRVEQYQNTQFVWSVAHHKHVVLNEKRGAGSRRKPALIHKRAFASDRLRLYQQRTKKQR